MSVWIQKQCVDRVTTVSELISALQKFPADASVMDDFGDLYSVQLFENEADPNEQYVTFEPAEND